MIRPLLITFVVASVVAVAAGVGISILHPASLRDSDKGGSKAQDPGPVVTRDFAWSGSPNLTISIPAEVTYVQGPAAKMTITGPSAMLDEIEISDGDIKFDCNFSFTLWSIKTDKGENEV
ncbi:MAG: hypothetical protein JWM33_598, partial [Caulobacteraceae bacterium]|nr:hypothetical protein [Caulobacteraceae bacterium]